jgi:hypothetical protein
LKIPERLKGIIRLVLILLVVLLGLKFVTVGRIATFFWLRIHPDVITMGDVRIPVSLDWFPAEYDSHHVHLSLNESPRQGIQLSRRHIAVEDLVVANQRLASRDTALIFDGEVEVRIGAELAHGVRLIYRHDEVRYRGLYTLPEREILVVIVYDIKAQEKFRTLLASITLGDHA